MSVFNENGELLNEEFHPYLQKKKDFFIKPNDIDAIHKAIKEMNKLQDMSKDDRDAYEKEFKSKRLFAKILDSITFISSIASAATILIPIPVLGVLVNLATRVFSLIVITVELFYHSKFSTDVIKDAANAMEKMKELENNTKDPNLKKALHDKYEKTDKLLDAIYKKAHPFKYKEAVKNKENESS